MRKNYYPKDLIISIEIFTSLIPKLKYQLIKDSHWKVNILWFSFSYCRVPF